MNWFKHDTDATTDAKVKKLIIKYGAIGYAIYFHCLELIASEISETNITFELEHDAEIIADDLRIKGDSNKSGIEIVEEVMRYMIQLNLFEESNGHIFCFKLLKRLDTSMTSNPKMRALIVNAKQNHDDVMIHHDNIMQDKIRIDKIRIDKINLNSENSEKTNKKEKHKYGEYKNVLLSDDEYNKLISELGEKKTNAVIQHYSELKEMKGYKYKSDYLAIKKWGINSYDEYIQRMRCGGSNIQHDHESEKVKQNLMNKIHLEES